MSRRRRQISAPDFAEQLQPEFEHESAAENSPEAAEADFTVIDQLPAVIGPENASEAARAPENGSDLLPVPYGSSEASSIPQADDTPYILAALAPERAFSTTDPERLQLPPGREPEKVAVIRQRTIEPTENTDLWLSPVDFSDPDIETFLMDSIESLADLEVGQYGRIAVDIRGDDNFTDRAQKVADTLDLQASKHAQTKRDADRDARGSAGEKLRDADAQRLAEKAQQAKYATKRGKDIETRLSKDSNFAEVGIHVVTGAIAPVDDAASVRRDLDVAAARAARPFTALDNGANRYQVARTNSRALDTIQGTDPKPAGRRQYLGRKELSLFTAVPDNTFSRDELRIHVPTLKPYMPTVMPPRFENPLKPLSGYIPMGRLPTGADDRVLGMPVETGNRHMLIAGGTGTGKSEFLKWIIFGQAAASYPVFVIDPHGQLSDEVLDMLLTYLPHRATDIVMLDVGMSGYSPALNPLDISDYSEVFLAAEQALAILRANPHINFKEDVQTRAYPLARTALLAMTKANLYLPPESKLTLLHVASFFKSRELRRMVVELSDDIKDVYETFDEDAGTFEKAREREQDEYTAPIIRVFGQLARDEYFSRAFATTNRVDFGELAAANKIVLCKLGGFSSEEALGVMAAQLVVPGLLRTMNEWGRVRDPHTGQYRGHGARVVIDEAPAVLRNSQYINIALSQARKWDLGLTLAAQYPEQFDNDLRRGIYANTAAKLALQLSYTNLAGFDKELSTDTAPITGTMISSMNPYEYYGKWLLDNGKSTGPLAALTEPPAEIPRTPELAAAREWVLERSRDLIGVEHSIADARRTKDALYERQVRAMIPAVKQQYAQQATEDPVADMSEAMAGVTEKDIDDAEGNIWGAIAKQQDSRGEE